MKNSLEPRKTLFLAYDHGYEEGWNLEIFEKNGQLWKQVIASTMYGDVNELTQITQEEAMSEMIDCAEFEDEAPVY